MELEHAFTVPVGVEEAWAVLRDIERVVPCMPGATIESVEGEHFTGSVKVKVGPITVQYRGEADFVDVDDQAHRAKIDAKGRETKGSGTARATVTAALHAVADGTRVELVTDLAVTGKPAQFGRSVMADVGSKLVGKFADCLSAELAAPAPASASAAVAEAAAAPGAAAVEAAAAPGAAAVVAPVAVPDVGPDEVAVAPATSDGAGAGPAGAAAPAERPPTRPRERPSDDAIDLLNVAGAPMTKALAPAAGVAALLLLLVWLLRRRST